MLYRQAKYDQSDPPGFDLDDPDDCKRLMLAWIRRSDPLPAPLRNMIANDLEDYYFPDVRRKRRRQRWAAHHQFMAQVYSDAINRIAADKSIPKYEAKLHICKTMGFQSVESLERYIRRGKNRRTKT
jgi:hypothetical protein